jgi:hypothetical protein
MKPMIVLFLMVLTTGCRETPPRAAVADDPGPVRHEGAVVTTTDEAMVPAGDLKHFPMPENLPGTDLVRGEVELLPPGPAPAPGSPGALSVFVRGDTTVVTVASIDVNCCTKQIRPSVEVRDGIVEIRLWEYMTDVCECFSRRSACFRLAPFDPAGLEFRVYGNDRTSPCGTGRAPD